MTTQTPLGQLMLDETILTFRKQKELADKAVAQLNDEQIREPLDENTNSVAVIMKHIAGNLRSRFTDFLTTDGEKPWRNRDSEFVDDFKSREDLAEFWERGWNCLFESLAGLTPEDLTATVTIREEPHSVVLAIQRSLAHCSYHVGQIMLVSRVLAKDHWTVLTIPRGKSEDFKRGSWKKS